MQELGVVTGWSPGTVTKSPIWPFHDCAPKTHSPSRSSRRLTRALRRQGTAVAAAAQRQEEQRRRSVAAGNEPPRKPAALPVRRQVLLSSPPMGQCMDPATAGLVFS
jgi:hypothetical protein